MQTFKEITGGTENTPEEALKKFPWLKNANFRGAQVDISNFLVWKNGTWKNGAWEYGLWKGGIWKGGIWKGDFWKDGTWEDGLWEGGIWKGGTWKGGKMWSNKKQKYEEIIQEDCNFKVKQP